MRRERFREQWNLGNAGESAMARSFEDDEETLGETSQEPSGETTSRELPASTIDHERARELIQEQTRRLLPPQEANALADHLLICDRCFRYAQDVAHQERQSGKHSAVSRGDSRPE
jgi:hypothetical protein